jgi:hypothetical protein
VISKFKSHEFDPTVQFLERYLSENEFSKNILDAKKTRPSNARMNTNAFNFE